MRHFISLIIVVILINLLFIYCGIKISGEITRKEDEESEGKKVQRRR